MFRSVSLGKKNPAAKAFFSLFCSLFLALLLFPVLGCQTEADDDPGIDLNPGLIGSWYKDFGGGYDDRYIITSTRVSHQMGSPDGPFDLNGTIEFVYNFDENSNSGCLIIKRETDNKYTAVYYKDLDENTVTLGDAYDSNPPDYDPAVDTLQKAKTKFAPENKSLYGGDLPDGVVSPLNREAADY